MKAATANAATLLGVVRKTANVAAVRSEVRRPFRFLLCGDPGLVAEFRALLLWARPDQTVADDAAATLETIDPQRRPTTLGSDARCVVFLGRPGDVAGARLDLLQQLRLPVFAVTVGAATPAVAQPIGPPPAGHVAEYNVARLDRESLRGRLFPHLIERCKGIEIAVGRRLPALRETVVSKLTRDAASSALKVAAASAVVDNVPLLGLVLGVVASAGDTVAITGIQVVLLVQIGALYGKEPDVGRVWDLLPVVGGGLGWRALSRELAGFVPVAGVAIKGAIAYAGTVVVGEGAGFFYEHGYHMTKTQAAQLYEEKKRSSLAFARDVIARITRSKS